MKITKISLTNFRSFKETQAIDVAPITLLFGPNSVGKSSVLMALSYVQQILDKGHCNPERLEAMGGKSIGGFRSLVHGQDLSNKIKIRIDFRGQCWVGDYDSFLLDHESNMNSRFIIMNPIGLDHYAVELEISWSNRHKWAYVNNYRVWIDDEYIGRVTSSEDLKNTRIVEINTQHPELESLGNQDWLEFQYGEDVDVGLLDESQLQSELEFVLSNINPNPISTRESADLESAGQVFVNRIAPISIGCTSGALPFIGEAIQSNLIGQEFEDSEDHLNYLAVRRILSEIFVSPLDSVLKLLKSSVAIGPLRIVPDSNFVINPYPAQREWVDGSAAWHLLHRNPEEDSEARKTIDRTSHWFSSNDRLDSGYRVHSIALSDVLDVNKKVPSYLNGLLSRRHVFFEEIRSGIHINSHQLGTGISQVLPVVVASLSDSIAMISVEQPELHIHPRLQVELADLFLESRNKHAYLIETHSEHIVLRMLRRIRESGSKSTGGKEVSPKDVRVVYLSPSENGTIASHIDITPDGDFSGEWPHGFFEERDQELF